MKIFVSGIAGFLGAHVAHEGIARGWEVAGIDNLLGGTASNVPEGASWLMTDCRSPREYGELLADTDVVYHTAAAPYEGLSVFSPQVVYEHTLMSTVALLRASITAGVKRFVFCSSMSRYGANPAPFTEDMPVAPEDPYADSKVAAEAAVRRLCALHGMEFVIVVPHNIYGPLQRYWDPYRNVAGIMINRILQGKRPIVYGDGSQRRCLSYISDVAPVLLRLGIANVAGEVINVGPGDEGCTILELASLIMDLCGMPGEPEFFPPRPAEVHVAHCSAGKAARLLGYEAKVDLKEGLTKYVEWISEQGPVPFDYHLPVEIISEKTPRTWSERLM